MPDMTRPNRPGPRRPADRPRRPDPCRRVLLIAAAIGTAACASPGTAPPSAVPTAVPSADALPALAPTGRLRAAIAVGPSASTFRATVDADTGAPRGVAVDLARAIGSRLGLPVDLLPYGNYPDLLSAGARGDWDICFLPYDDARARTIDYGPSYFDQSYTYLVREGVPGATVADLDRIGLRLAVADGSVTERNRASALKAATIVRFRTLDEIRDRLRAGEVDAAGAGRETLVGLAAQVPGSRVLDDAFLVERVAIGVPTGRGVALSAAADAMEAAKRDGSVRRAFDAAGFRDAAVAPPDRRR